MNYPIQKIYLFLFLWNLIAACNPTKNLAENEIYLRKNVIKISPNIVSPDQLYPYIKQRENKRSLWFFKVKMQQYLLFNDSILEIKNQQKLQKLIQKNRKRLEIGKDTIEFKPVLGSRIKKNGEPPVVFDSALVKETILQFEKALFNRGYFNNHVFAEQLFNRDSNRVTIVYRAVEGPQYRLNQISISLSDTGLRHAVKDANIESLLHRGDPYLTEQIESERSRFSKAMRNQGYYFFSKEYLKFEVDSTIGNHRVNIKMIISNPKTATSTADTVLHTDKHKKYRIGSITLNTNFNPRITNDPNDSIHFKGLIFSNISQLQYNPITFTDKLFFQSGDWYNETAQSRTYTRLSGLNNFKYIDISFSLSENDSNTLDCSITMTPLPLQKLGIELEGTNTSTNLGVSGYLSYTHRNIFRKSEHLRMRLKGGVEAQQTNTTDENLGDGIRIFNTVEYGMETSLIFQDLILPHFLQDKILRMFNRPKTSINLILNYQNRPDFERFLSNASIGYVFTQQKHNTNEFFVYPVNVSYIRVQKSIAFNNRLEELNNPLLNATYDNQFIIGFRVLENWSNRNKSHQKNFTLNLSQFEIAGNMLQLGSKILDAPSQTDDNGNQYYTVGGVRYAQFLKLQNEWRYHARIKRNQVLAYRILTGIGVPYGNAISLPYDRSFYGGGANDNRGWRARTLGPGSMIDSLKVGVDQVADIKIQLGIEYRFDIFKSLGGAVFADAGNIWLLQKDNARPRADFEWTRFYKEFALSTGIGARFNFGFLLIRLDWGFKIYDPNLPEGERFVLQKISGGYIDNYSYYSQGRRYNHSVVNLGIGYPF